MAEVLLCDDHEPDFVYWFREAGGAEYRGSDDLGDAFHEWFLEGGEAPEGYASITHVDTDPDALPDPEAAVEAANGGADADDEGEGEPDDDGTESDDPALDTDDSDLDLSREYP
jgi:hypothetical protein